MLTFDQLISDAISQLIHLVGTCPNDTPDEQTELIDAAACLLACAGFIPVLNNQPPHIREQYQRRLREALSACEILKDYQGDLLKLGRVRG